jgi:hypothetical protein
MPSNPCSGSDVPSPLAVRHIHSTCRHAVPAKWQSPSACRPVLSPAFYPPFTRRCGPWQLVVYTPNLKHVDYRALRNYYRRSRLAWSRNPRRHRGSRYVRYHSHPHTSSFPSQDSATPLILSHPRELTLTAWTSLRMSSRAPLLPSFPPSTSLTS